VNTRVQTKHGKVGAGAGHDPPLRVRPRTHIPSPPGQSVPHGPQPGVW